jgi:SPP1 gp7 family putative phage head morphogenesis protein
VEAHEDLIAGKVRDFNNRQERDVVQRLKQLTRGIKKGDILDMDGEVSLLVDFVAPMLRGLMVEQAVEEFVASAFPGQLDQSEPRIRKVVQAAATRLGRSYNKTTVKLLADALDTGISNGEDLTQLAERVRQVYEFSNKVRAVAVAKTEAFYIANEGSREAFRQSGVVKTMRWYTAEDEKVCEFCGPENGRIVSIDEPFYEKGHELIGRDGGKLNLDYRTIDVPPLHTSCRCFIRPELIEVG